MPERIGEIGVSAERNPGKEGRRSVEATPERGGLWRLPRRGGKGVSKKTLLPRRYSSESKKSP